MRQVGYHSRGILVLLAWLAAGPLAAQKPPDPEVGYVFPPAVPRGGTTAVELAGFDWTDDLEFFVLDSRVTVTTEGRLSRHLLPGPPYPVGMRAYKPPALPREMAARLTIPADIPCGMIRWQVANANGASNTGVFVVSDRPDVLEERSGNDPQRLEQLPATVSGRLERFEEVDRYAITAPDAGLITCDLQARQLGSNFHGVLEVKDELGRLVADAVDSQGMDTSVTWMAQAGRNYLVSVRDLNFRGNRAYVYRLAATRGPRTVAAFPAAGRWGETSTVELIGYGVATGQNELERIERTIRFPSDTGLTTWLWQGQAENGQAIEYSFPLSDQSETAASPSADVSAITTSTAYSGRLDRLRPTAQFSLAGETGEVWRFDAQARRFGSPLDLSLSIADAEGKELAANDDLPGTTDAGLDFTIPADGSYRIAVKDVAGTHRSPLAIYRFTASQSSPDFRLSVVQHVNVPIGDKVELPVKAVRTGGFAGPIRLSVTGLPPGINVPAEMAIAANQTEYKIPLQSAIDAPSGAALVMISGTASIGDQQQARVALASAAGNLAARAPEESLVERVLIAGTMKPVTKIRPLETDERTAHRGTIHLAELAIERQSGFDGEVVVQMDSRQPAKFRQGVIGPDVLVPAGADRVFYPCLVPNCAETTDAYRCLLTAVAQVPDPRGRMRQLLSKMQADDASVAITVEGALLKIAPEAERISFHPGEVLEVPVKISRSAKLPAEVRVELCVPEQLADSLHAEPVVVPVNENRCVLRVVMDRAISAELPLRAIAFQAGMPPRLSETANSSPLDGELISLLALGRLPVVAESSVILVPASDH